ncbi:MAG: YbjN domain-containing protein [Cellulomonadaceae bacterium]|jgi:hypothetical protein|nr:YbjN domain-containing protein [Cellulomonadaceae bacterium]
MTDDHTHRSFRERILGKRRYVLPPALPGDTNARDKQGNNTPAPPRPALLAPGRIGEELARRGYRFRLDADGDVTGVWDGNQFWFLLLGDHKEVLQVRARWANTVDDSARLSILQAANDWNRDRLWPKVYVREEDELAVYAEVSVDFEHGATDAQLADTISCGLATATQFFTQAGVFLEDE